MREIRGQQPDDCERGLGIVVADLLFDSTTWTATILETGSVPEAVSVAGGRRKSLRSIVGYAVYASDADGDVGCVVDFIVDTERSIIRYVVVDTRPWLPNRRIVVPTHCVEAIQEAEHALELHLSKATIRSKPEFVG